MKIIIVVNGEEIKSDDYPELVLSWSSRNIHTLQVTLPEINSLSRVVKIDADQLRCRFYWNEQTERNDSLGWNQFINQSSLGDRLFATIHNLIQESLTQAYQSQKMLIDYEPEDEVVKRLKVLEQGQSEVLRDFAQEFKTHLRGIKLLTEGEREDILEPRQNSLYSNCQDDSSERPYLMILSKVRNELDLLKQVHSLEISDWERWWRWFQLAKLIFEQLTEIGLREDFEDRLILNRSVVRRILRKREYGENLTGENRRIMVQDCINTEGELLEMIENHLAIVMPTLSNIGRSIESVLTNSSRGAPTEFHLENFREWVSLLRIPLVTYAFCRSAGIVLKRRLEVSITEAPILFRRPDSLLVRVVQDLLGYLRSPSGQVFSTEPLFRPRICPIQGSRETENFCVGELQTSQPDRYINRAIDFIVESLTLEQDVLFTKFQQENGHRNFVAFRSEEELKNFIATFAYGLRTEMRCPISRSTMEDPCIFPSGRSYERGWLRESGRGVFMEPTPTATEPLRSEDIRPNTPLKKLIQYIHQEEIRALIDSINQEMVQRRVEEDPERARKRGLDSQLYSQVLDI